MKSWAVFDISSKTPVGIAEKLKELLSRLEANNYDIVQIQGPYPMAIHEGGKDVGQFLNKIFKVGVTTTFTAFVVAKK